MLIGCVCSPTQAASNAKKTVDPLAKYQQLLSTGQLEDCEQQLATLLRSNGTDLEARKLHAEALFRLGRFHFAQDELKEVFKVQAQDSQASLLMAKILQSIHQPAQAVEYYKKYLAQAPASDSAQQYQLLINVLQEEAEQNAKKQEKSRAQAGDYISAIAGSGLMRWKTPSALSVYIKDGTGVEGYRPEFEESLRQAFDDWTLNTNGKIAFVFVTDPTQAQMDVTWTSDLHSPALKAEAGLAKTSYGPDGINKAEILLLTVDPFKEGPIARNYLYNICLHEIGHALGLQGHSPYPDDIMASSLYVQHGLSDRDINTILVLYSRDAASVADLPDKDEYGRPLPPAVKAERLANTGTAAAMAGKYETAIEKLQAALELNPNMDLAKKNLAVAANNLAIADGTSDEKGLALLHLSLYWDPQNKAGRENLNSRLRSAGKDPFSQPARLALAEQYLAAGKRKAAIVEYREALAIKENPVIREKLNGLTKTSRP